MIDMHDVLRCLAAQRPVFHSEADFQHALAWTLQTLNPDMQIRLEYPLRAEDGSNARIHLDIRGEDSQHVCALELKYKTRGPLEVEVAGECYYLKNHSAQDYGRFDFLKDVQRLERAVANRPANRPANRGYAILLTNDHLYWTSPTQDVVDLQFRLHEGDAGQVLLGDRKAVLDGSERKVHLAGSYPICWQEYSLLDAATYGRFRYLLVQVQ